MPQLFRHEALPYTAPSGFVRSCSAAVRDGVENDERVIVLATGPGIDGVRAELGSDADDVAFVATDEHGRNPARMATLLDSFQAAGDGSPALGVMDVSFSGRSAAAAAELRFADAVLNSPALRTWPMSVVCLYDADHLDDAGRHAMRQSHAVVRGQDINVDYEPNLAQQVYASPVGAAPAGAARLEVTRPSRGQPQLGRMRDFVRHQGARHRIAADRIDDLVLAANEIVTNSLRHGGGRARMAVWFADGSIVCEVRDTGFIPDPLAGRFAPPPSATSGRGLWLANHLCDLVQVRSSANGSVVRMYVDR